MSAKVSGEPSKAFGIPTWIVWTVLCIFGCISGVIFLRGESAKSDLRKAEEVRDLQQHPNETPQQKWFRKHQND